MGSYIMLFSQFMSAKDNINRDLGCGQTCHTNCKITRLVFWQSKSRANKTFLLTSRAKKTH